MLSTSTFIQTEVEVTRFGGKRVGYWFIGIEFMFEMVRKYQVMMVAQCCECAMLLNYTLTNGFKRITIIYIYFTTIKGM